MKTKTYITSVSVIFLSTIILLFSACGGNFLHVSPKEAVNAKSFFSTKKDAIQGINATYASLQPGLYNQWYPKLVSGASDDFILYNTNDVSISEFTWGANLQSADYVWQACYEGIFRANMVLQNVPGINMDQGLKERILGEAHFLRALYYWHLMILFGGVPLIKKAYPNDPYKAVLPRSTPSKVVDFMVSNLKKAENMLPVNYDDANVGRATKGAAEAMLGKVYLYGTSKLFGGNTADYDSAATELKKVIDSGIYHLVPYKELWVVDNNPESIFEVQYAQTGGSIWANGPTTGADEANLRAVLNLMKPHGGYGNLPPTQSLVDAFEDYSGHDPQHHFNGKDPRLYYSVWRQGDPYDKIEPTFQASWSPTGYAMKKGLYPIQDRNQDGTDRNVPIIRLGGVYLMYAEAVNATSSREPSVALKYLNKIRDRVNMPHYPTAEYPCNNQQQIFNAIVHERRVELFAEYQRYNDLRRWGLAKKILGPLGFKAPRDLFFAIPVQEIDQNPKLKQNPGY